ncbi:MAG: hypothetical protein U9R79_09545 [Armatimonadota bacterium]|nr:hypothetical protein [Armatimonadota bacterium]
MFSGTVADVGRTGGHSLDLQDGVGITRGFWARYLPLTEPGAWRVRAWVRMRGGEAGLRDTRILPQIAVLHSRASEDFWQLRQELNFEADLRVAGIRGYVAHRIVEELLLRHSYPFEVHYLEREDELAHLSDYPLIVLPFPYCISNRAAAAVEEGRRAGSRILICERLGEADEVGTGREIPAMAGWADGEDVVLVENLVDEFTDPAFRAELLGTLDDLLGESRAIELDRQGRNVEAILRRGDDGWLLATINWEPEDVGLEVRLRLPEGSYRVRQCDGYGERPCAIGEREELTGADLAHLWVKLERNQVRIYQIRTSAPAQTERSR